MIFAILTLIIGALLIIMALSGTCCLKKDAASEYRHALSSRGLWAGAAGLALMDPIR